MSAPPARAHKYLPTREPGFQRVPVCKQCAQPADLESYSHMCIAAPVPVYRCMDCWLSWMVGITETLLKHGEIRCGDCGSLFKSVRAFSDYKRFKE